MNFRSIDSIWEGDDYIVLEDDGQFRKIINGEKTYYVKFRYFMSLAKIFQGKTAVNFAVRDNWWSFYNFKDGELVEEEKGPRVKCIDKEGNCIYFSYIAFENSTAYNKVYHYDKNSCPPFICEDYEKYYGGTERFNDLLSFLSQYDEPSFAEY